LWTPDTAITEPQHNDDSRLIKSSAEFVAGFVPPDYVVVGLLQRRFLYSNTGQTGAGKTAVTLRLAASTAQGTTFAGRETKKCRVLYAAAENPDDVRMRWIAPRAAYGFDTDTIELYFTEGRFTISKMATQLRAEAEKRGGEFGLVVIDTGPAFFEGDDENSRAQMGAHAAKLAQAMGWKLFSGEPNKMRAKRCVDALKRAKLIKETRTGRWQLTPEGSKVLKGETDDKNAVTVATAKMLQP